MARHPVAVEGLAGGAAGELGRLLEAEAELRSRGERAEAEAARLVNEARREAEAALERVELELREALAQLDRQVEAEMERERERIEAKARREAAAYDRLLADRGDELVEYVVHRVIGAGASDGPAAPLDDDHRNVEGAGSRPAP